ncbi:MAG TPA: alpha/beta hydrolase family protein [Dongiaceae bacterium]|nr:alpha/beta hydrolase family protein [Dongiaceae bacterium]
MKIHLALAWALGWPLACSPARVMAQSTPSPSQGQRWLAGAGQTPDFHAPASRKAWATQRERIRAQLWQLLGSLPPRPKKASVQTLGREERDGCVLERFQFDNGAGADVPGYLLLPKKARAKAPAILYCHWHGGQYDIGKEELFRTNAVPEPPGPALARRGYVVLGIDAYCFGQRNGQGPGGPAETGSAGEVTASKFFLWTGRSLWGMIVRDDLMALDYLCSRPEVDASRVGVTGISMGATRTWWSMALDERPKTGVAVGCLTRYQNLIQNEGLKYHGIYYFVPRMLRHFDTEAVVALAAPRPMLFMTGDQDFGSPTDGIRVIESKVRPIYALYGKKTAFENILYPGVGHVYLPEMWQNTMAWMDKNL